MAAVQPVLKSAADRFVSMREAEGVRMKEDVLARAGTILSLVEKVEERSPQSVSAYEQKLRAKIQEMLGDAQVDEQRLLTETAIFADKVAVAEETVRLRSHFGQMKTMLNSDEAVGAQAGFPGTGNEPRSQHHWFQVLRCINCLHGGGYKSRDREDP